MTDLLQSGSIKYVQVDDCTNALNVIKYETVGNLLFGPSCGRTYESTGIQLLEQLSKIFEHLQCYELPKKIGNVLEKYLEEFKTIQVFSELKVIFQSKILNQPDMSKTKFDLEHIENQEALRKINEQLLNTLSKYKNDFEEPEPNQDFLNNEFEVQNYAYIKNNFIEEEQISDEDFLKQELEAQNYVNIENNLIEKEEECKSENYEKSEEDSDQDYEVDSNKVSKIFKDDYSKLFDKARKFGFEEHCKISLRLIKGDNAWKSSLLEYWNRWSSQADSSYANMKSEDKSYNELFGDISAIKRDIMKSLNDTANYSENEDHSEQNQKNLLTESAIGQSIFNVNDESQSLNIENSMVIKEGKSKDSFEKVSFQKKGISNIDKSEINKNTGKKVFTSSKKLPNTALVNKPPKTNSTVSEKKLKLKGKIDTIFSKKS